MYVKRKGVCMTYVEKEKLKKFIATGFLVCMGIGGIFTLGVFHGQEMVKERQQRAEREAKQAAVRDSLRNTVEYKQALEMYNQLSDEQKQLIQQENIKTK